MVWKWIFRHACFISSFALPRESERAGPVPLVKTEWLNILSNSCKLPLVSVHISLYCNFLDEYASILALPVASVCFHFVGANRLKGGVIIKTELSWCPSLHFQLILFWWHLWRAIIYDYRGNHVSMLFPFRINFSLFFHRLSWISAI